MVPNPKRSRRMVHHSTSCSSSSNNNDATTTALPIVTGTTGVRRRSKENTKISPSNLERASLAEYIPPYLRNHVQSYHGDFCYTPMFHPFLIAQLMMEGFLPIACSDFLLPKLHVHRCIISLENSQEGPTAGSSFHIGKQVRKKSKRYNVSINQSFETVVAACHRQHGDHCWLYPPLIDAFRAIHDKTVTDSKQCEIGGGFITKTMDGQSVPVRLYSIEVWNVETGSLAAGELGYTVGSIYTSLTGFSSEDSAGSIQLATLGTLLVHNGFSVWDLGMEMPYKTALGSRLAPRDEFVRIVHSSRHRDVPLRLLPVRPPLQANNNNSTVDPGGVERLGCREVLDFRPTPQHAEDTAVNATQQQQQDAILVATSSIQLDLHDMQNIKR